MAASSSDLAFKGRAPAVADILSKRTQTIVPIDGWQENAGKVIWMIPTSSTEWISTTFLLHARFTILNGGITYYPNKKAWEVLPNFIIDSSQIDGTNNVAFISGPITSLFQDAELTIGGVVVEGLNQASSWTGFLKSTLGLSPAAAKSWGRDALKVLPDAPGQSQSQLGANNPGFAQRKLLTADSAYTSVLGPLSFDVSSSGLAVPGSTSIRITLTHRPNSERLVSSDAGADYILTFERLEVIATYLSISESALLALRHKQAAGSLTLNFLRTSFTGPNLVPSGVREHTFTISRGRVPELVLIGLAPTVFTESAYDSLLSLLLYFLCFNDCGVNFLQCMVAGRLFPAAPLTPDFATGADTMPIFLSFLECAKLYNDQEISITFDRWRNGCCIFPVQLRVHMPSLAYQNPPLEGDLICRIKFSAATTENINIFVYGVSPARIGISPQNTVQLIDFAGS